MAADAVTVVGQVSAHALTTVEFDRIEHAAESGATVLAIIGVVSPATFAAVHQKYLDLTRLTHPHRGGSFNKPRASKITTIVARAFEQIKREEMIHSYRAHGSWASVSEVNQKFVVPSDLLYSNQETEEERDILGVIQNEAEEAEEAATAAAVPITVDDEDDDDDEEGALNI